MNLKIFALIIFASIFTIIATANAKNPVSRHGERNISGFNLAMMGGGGGMMGGGVTGGQGIFNGFGWPRNNTRVPADEYRQNRHLNNQSVRRQELQRLHERIQQKRKDLSSLYRSGNVDKEEINKKIAELNNLERDLDNRMSSSENDR